MPKAVRVTVKPEQTEPLVSDLSREEGVVSLEVYKASDAREKHDVISLLAVSNRMANILRIIGRNTRDGPETLYHRDRCRLQPPASGRGETGEG